MGVTKTYDEINAKIKEGKAVVVTAEEVIKIVQEKGLEKATEEIDVVTTATFGPMCSTGAFLNFGHADPPIRMSEILLNDVEAYGGLAAVDTYIGATAESKTQGALYGGAHVICDLIAGKEVELKAYSRGTDCYPRKEVKTYITKDSLNEAYLFNPRNSYQNYSAAINTSSKNLKTYMGTLLANKGNVNYCTSGALSPLFNDPTYRTIGVGTHIFLCGAEGYVAWQGTQFNSANERDENGIPYSPSGTLALIGDLKNMKSEYISPAVFDGYGVSMFVGVGIPIPILDIDMMKAVSIDNKDLFTNIIDYSVEKNDKPSLGLVSYEQLRSGSIELDGKSIKTAPITSMKKSREIANELKDWILKGSFVLQEPIKLFPQKSSLTGLEIREATKDEK
ncbi:MAG: homocysteine biosynthesis protein [Peptostreptococcaceae bacterium]|nr:homocysteine biosynthesis protein [Peptostreptococcaceae bacterium]